MSEGRDKSVFHQEEDKLREEDKLVLHLEEDKLVVVDIDLVEIDLVEVEDNLSYVLPSNTKVFGSVKRLRSARLGTQKDSEYSAELDEIFTSLHKADDHIAETRQNTVRLGTETRSMLNDLRKQLG